MMASSISSHHPDGVSEPAAHLPFGTELGKLVADMVSQGSVSSSSRTPDLFATHHHLTSARDILSIKTPANATTATAIAWDYLPDNKVSSHYAAALLGTDANLHHQAITDKVHEIERDKKKVKRLAGDVIERWMLECAKQVNMKSKDGRAAIESFSQIGEQFSYDPSEKNAQNLWFVQYGSFDQTPLWQDKLEMALMDKMDWVYEDSKTDRGGKEKGCVYKQISSKRSQLQKGIKTKCLKSGYYVICSRPGKENGKQASRRTKGQYMAEFLVAVGPTCIPSSINCRESPSLLPSATTGEPAVAVSCASNSNSSTVQLALGTDTTTSTLTTHGSVTDQVQIHELKAQVQLYQSQLKEQFADFSKALEKQQDEHQNRFKEATAKTVPNMLKKVLADQSRDKKIASKKHSGTKRKQQHKSNKKAKTSTKQKKKEESQKRKESLSDDDTSDDETSDFDSSDDATTIATDKKKKASPKETLSDDGTSDDDSLTDSGLLAEKDDDEVSVDLEDDIAYLKNELICKGIHLPGADGRYDATKYKDHEDNRYFDRTWRGMKCGDCEKIFTNSNNEAAQEGYIKPTTKTVVKICCHKGGHEECQHALCHHCFAEGATRTEEERVKSGNNVARSSRRGTKTSKY